MKKIHLAAALAALATAAAVVGCATTPSGADLDKVAQDMVRTGFHAKGIAGLDRVTNIDETLKLCNEADVSGKPLDAATAKRIEEANLKTV
jgi:sulfur-oxidizing protein SoxX